MSTRTYRGVVKGRSIVLLESAAVLPEGTEVSVTPLAPRPGTATALLAALQASPDVPPEDVDELERLIAEGKRTLLPKDIFPEEVAEKHTI